MKNNKCTKKLSLIFLLIFCFFAVSSCITTRQDVIYLNQQIVALNNRVSDLEGSSDLRTESASIRQSQADMVSDIEGLKDEMQQLTAKVENNDLLIRRSLERDTGEQDALKATIAGLNERITKLEEQLAQLKSQPASPPTGTEPSRPTEKPSEKPAPAADETLYNSSLNLFKEGKYDKAIEGFKNFLQKYADSELADNAQFWLGECHMATKQYEQAILAYQKVIKDYPDGNKVPNAIFRQAAAFTEINDKISAKLLLKKVIKNYPDSPEAKKAESQLRKLEQ
jgi:tol-pal system protein YbgF